VKEVRVRLLLTGRDRVARRLPGGKSAQQGIDALRIESLLDDMERHTGAALLRRSGSVEDQGLVRRQLADALGYLGVG
jgi:hypothetical protein